MLSPRYAPYLLAFLAPPMVVVVMHSYIGLRAANCSKATSLFSAQSIGPGEFRDKAFREVLGAESWDEGALLMSRPDWQGNYAVVQSYDAKKLYHRPENLLLRGASPAKRTIEQVQADGGDLVTVYHVYYPATESTVLHAAYILIYDSQPVENPYWAQIRLAPAQILRGTYAMTLSFVSVRGPAGDAEELQKQAVSFLLDSWRKYKVACSE